MLIETMIYIANILGMTIVVIGLFMLTILMALLAVGLIRLLIIEIRKNRKQ